MAADTDASPMPADIAAFVERMNGCCRTLVTIGTPDALAASDAVCAALVSMSEALRLSTAAMSKAVAAMAKAQAMLAITIGGTAAGQFDPHGGIASPVEIADGMLLQGLVAAMPDIGIEAHLRAWSMYTFRRTVEPANPIAAAIEFGDRLRETAGRIRAGEIGSALPAHHDAPPDFTPDSPEAEIYVLSPFQYVGAARDRVMVTGGLVSLPVPVAERAIELVVASDVPTRQWQNAQKAGGPLAAPHQGTGGIGWDEAFDIEFDRSARYGSLRPTPASDRQKSESPHPHRPSRRRSLPQRTRRPGSPWCGPSAVTPASSRPACWRPAAR